MGQTLSQCIAIVEDMSLTQDNGEIMDLSSMIIDNEETSSCCPELMNDVLEKMVVVLYEELVKLYFQWKVCLLYEREWWPNATHNLKNQIYRKHEMVLSRINNLEKLLIKKRGM